MTLYKQQKQIRIAPSEGATASSGQKYRILVEKLPSDAQKKKGDRARAIIDKTITVEEGHGLSFDHVVVTDYFEEGEE